MRITFYSNFLTHHQLPFCLGMYNKYGENFKFVSTVKINEERLSLGYENMDDNYPFVLKAYEDDNLYNKAISLALDSDVVIMGSTQTDEYITERLKQDKLTFRYYARIFYRGIFSIFDLKNIKTVYNKHYKFRKNKNLYLLCASGYATDDFNKMGMYTNKCFKWGYFPETKLYDEKALLGKKENKKINIIWVGRFVKEKHPSVMIKLAKKLKTEGYDFEMKMLGNGVLFNDIKNKVNKLNLQKEIILLGAVESSKVRSYMEKSNIFVCTSDRTERWAVVLNEAMNSGCVTIANKEIGGVPFLIDNGVNGFWYQNFNDLYAKVVKVINNKKLMNTLSLNAYKTISTIWTADNAVNNFELLVNSIINKQKNPINTGPASNSYPMNK